MPLASAPMGVALHMEVPGDLASSSGLKDMA
jgi:hypothetical protein